MTSLFHRSDRAAPAATVSTLAVDGSAVWIWLAGAVEEAGEVDVGVAASGGLPVRDVGEALCQQRAERDDVRSGHVGPDRAVVSSLFEDRAQSPVGFVPDRDG